MLANTTQELTSRDDATSEARALDTRLAAQRQRRWAGRMDETSRTPLKTEAKWLLGGFLVAGGIAIGGAIYFIWRVMAAGAGC